MYNGKEMQVMEMALISLIVPVYNGEKLLPKAVDSALAQVFTDFELILVDDGSADGTAALCDAYAAGDGRIKVIHQKNAGVSAARNAGIKAAQGRYLAFLDADDWLEPDFLSAMLSAVEETGARTGACGHFYDLPDGSQVPEAAPMAQGYHSADETREGICLPLLADRLRANPLNGYLVRYLYDAALIKDHSLAFTGAYLEDELFLIEYFAIGSDLAVADRPLYHYYMNPGSVTHRYLYNYTDVFRASFRLKHTLVEKYALDVPADWTYNTSWASLLIAVANEFAPGNSASLGEKVKHIKSICAMEPFKGALENYVPEGMNRNKSLVAFLLRRRLFYPLALLYAVKNRNRS